jgi:hypothetical protein
MWQLLLRGLSLAAGAIRQAAKSPAMRKAAINAAKKAGNTFSRFATKSKQLCTKAWRTIRGRNIQISPQTLQKKFKHASDFGVGGNYSPANASKFGQAIEKHVADSTTQVMRGTYRGEPVTHYFNPQTGLNVIKNPAGEFVSGWKLTPAQMKYMPKLGGG